MTGDDHARERHAGLLRPAQDLEPGRLLGGRLGVRARDLLPVPRHADDATRRPPATRPTASRSALHLHTSLPGLHAGVARGGLTDQLAALRGRLAERRGPRHQPHPLHRLERLGHASRSSRSAHGIRFDTNYYYNGPAGLADAARACSPAPGFPQRFADLDGSMIDVYQAMTQVTDESEMPMAPQVGHAARQRARRRRPGTAWSPSTSTPTTATTPTRTTSSPRRRSAACRWCRRPRCSTGSTGATAPRSRTWPTAAGSSPSRVVTNPKARGLEAMLPAQSRLRAAVAA